jgi:ferritin-like metal-binding protein YciE
MAHHDLFVAWLNDAYAMENGIIQSLESQVDLAKDHPAVQQGIQRHLETTRRHAEAVKGCLEQLGETPSTVKSAMATVGGKVQGMMPGAAKDDLIKAAMQDYSVEHMEIASYQSLIVAAEELGHTEMVATFRGILEDEQAMARWLEENMPLLTREALLQGQT